MAHSVYLIAGGGIFLGALSFWGARPLMMLLGTPENIIDQSVIYLQITGGLTLALLAYNGVSAILRAIGDSRTPLYFLIFCSILNVLLDLLFVLAFHGGVAGVAYATVISQGLSAVLCLIYMLKKYPRLRPDRASFRFDGKLMGDYLRIGLPMLSLIHIVFSAVGNSLTEKELETLPDGAWTVSYTHLPKQRRRGR